MAGFVLRDSTEGVREDALTRDGTQYTLGRATLLLIFYPDDASRRADEARLDSTRYVPAAQPLTMRREATRIGSVNLLAILRSTSDRQRERVADALQAGPPQPRMP